MQEFKKSRTAAVTIKDLLKSKRFELAVEFFAKDPVMMEAILIELCMEAARAQRTAISRMYATHYSGMDLNEMKAAINSCDPGVTWNMYWNMTPIERALYSIDPKCKKSRAERDILLDQLKKFYEETPEEIMESIPEAE